MVGVGVAAWNTSAAGAVAAHPADRHVPPGGRHFVRAVDVDADAATTWRWVCQLSVAPYSYDLVDNLGRRSPRTLTPGLDELAVGQQVATVFRLHSFVPGRELTLVLPPGPAARASGDMVVSYAALPGGSAGTSRLVAVLRLQALPRPVAAALCWGDLVMMRRQLLNLAALAGGR